MTSDAVSTNPAYSPRAISLVALAQSPIRIAGVEEPPELTGEPKPFTKPPETFRELADVFPTNEKNADKARIGIEKLTKVLRENPDYSDGYFMRAMFNRCMLNSNDTEGILQDINTAISTHSVQKFPGAYDSLADHYSFRAKVEFDNGRHREALDDLERAVRQKIDKADSIFGSGGTTPDAEGITVLYTEEALGTFRAGNHLASAVMIGVAAESVLLRLVDAVHAALKTPERQGKFEKDTKGMKAKKQHDEVLKRLTSPAAPLPAELESVLTQHIDAIYDLIRRNRNDAGHPTGNRMERDETQALLLLFPPYCKTVHNLIEWLAKNQI